VKFDSAVKKGRWGLAAGIVILVLALTVSVASRFLGRSGVPNQQVPEALRLTVEPVGSSLRVIWDRNASAIRGAAHAVLHIQDADRHIDTDLTPSMFRAGNFIYEPKSSQVTFRLDVYSVGPNATGVVQVMTLSPQSTTTQAQPGEPTTNPAPRLEQRLSDSPEQFPRQVPVATEFSRRERGWPSFAGRKISFSVGVDHSRQLAPGISLGVTKTTVDHRVDGWMWVMPDRRTIWLRNQRTDDPVIFYGHGDGRKRELRITDVTRTSVAGYLILPGE
jgi:hypothetical protein